MILLLTLALLASPAPAAQKIDTTQVTLLRYQLKEQLGNDMKQQHDAMKAELDSFKRELREEADKNLQNAKDDLRSQMTTYALIGGIVIGLLNFFGYDRIKKSISRSIAKYDKQIEKAFYSIDPRGMPIKLPAAGMEKQIDRLRELEFTHLDKYQWLDDSCTRNAVVVLATKDEDAEKLKNFMVTKELAERNDLAFVVYTKGARINPAILGEFDNVTFANNHLTLVQALFVAARGIVRQAQ